MTSQGTLNNHFGGSSKATKDIFTGSNAVAEAWNRDAIKVTGHAKFLQPNPGSEWTDLSSASFYGVTTTGKDGLKVQYGKEIVDSSTGKKKRKL